MSIRAPPIFNDNIKMTTNTSRPVVMSIMGFQGYQGTNGDFGGPQGFQGDQGTQGTEGLQGSVGLQGEKGDWGEKGYQGEKGEKGDAGLQGKVGLVGAEGTQGVEGPRGLQGSDGSKGDMGRSGYQGDQGQKGDVGLQGGEGSQGVQGTQGVMGAQGQFGGLGLQGSQGTQGLMGNDGLQGRMGVQGVIGLRGLPSGNRYTSSYTPVVVADTMEESALYSFNILSPVSDELYKYTVTGFLDCDVNATLTWRFYIGSSIVETIPVTIVASALPRDFRITYERMVVDGMNSLVPIFVGISDPLGVFTSSSQSTGFAISNYAGGSTTNERPTEQLTVQWDVARSGCRVVMSGYFVEKVASL